MDSRDPKITMDTVRDAYALTGDGPLAWEGMRDALRDLAALGKISKRLTALGVRQCNGIPRWNAKHQRVLTDWTDADQETNDKAVLKAANKALAILNPYGCKVQFQRDPRGSPMTVTMPNGREFRL